MGRQFRDLLRPAAKYKNFCASEKSKSGTQDGLSSMRCRLQAIPNLLSSTAGGECLRRPSNLVARYGGEEFMFLLLYTDLAGAMTVAKELRQLLFVQQIAHAESSVAKVVTVSLGVCCKPARLTAGGCAETFMREADAQLYEAKARGCCQASGAEMHEA